MTKDQIFQALARPGIYTEKNVGIGNLYVDNTGIIQISDHGVELSSRNLDAPAFELFIIDDEAKYHHRPDLGFANIFNPESPFSKVDVNSLLTKKTSTWKLIGFDIGGPCDGSLTDDAFLSLKYIKNDPAIFNGSNIGITNAYPPEWTAENTGDLLAIRRNLRIIMKNHDNAYVVTYSCYPFTHVEIIRISHGVKCERYSRFFVHSRYTIWRVGKYHNSDQP